MGTAPHLIVLGGGGHARVVIATSRAAGRTIAGVIVDDLPVGASVFGVPVLGGTTDAQRLAEGRQGVLAIGNNRKRQALATALHIAWATLIHPSAVVAEDAKIGPGTVVFAGAVIQPGVTIGAHAIVNTAASIDHDCEIGAYCHLAPGVHLGGDIKIQEGAFLGIGAIVLPQRSIGAWATLGAGAVAIADIAPGVTAVGAPARVVSHASGKSNTGSGKT